MKTIWGHPRKGVQIKQVMWHAPLTGWVKANTNRATKGCSSAARSAKMLKKAHPSTLTISHKNLFDLTFFDDHFSFSNEFEQPPTSHLIRAPPTKAFLPFETDPTSQRVYGPKIMLIDPSYESTKASFSHQKKVGMVGGHA
ncbi:hypothetical protein JHK82_047713 [Glycine max]|nr:hypothetical protein JHK82_047713 [Glycine max]